MELFWRWLTDACLAWYTLVTLYVGVGGQVAIVGGERDRERRPAADFALHVDQAAVLFDDGSRNGQPQAGAAGRSFAVATFIAPIEPFEHVRQILRGDADAGVAD